MKSAEEIQSPEAIDSPGKCLKAKRESQNISLREVANATRIREAVLRAIEEDRYCLLYTSPSPRDRQKSRMPSSA